MEVVPVQLVVVGTEHGIEVITGPVMDSLEEAAFRAGFSPVCHYADLLAVSEDKPGNVYGIGGGMFAASAVAVVVDVTTSVGPEMADALNRGAEEFLRDRLQGMALPPGDPSQHLALQGDALPPGDDRLVEAGDAFEAATRPLGFVGQTLELDTSPRQRLVTTLVTSQPQLEVVYEGRRVPQIERTGQVVMVRCVGKIEIDRQQRRATLQHSG